MVGAAGGDPVGVQHHGPGLEVEATAVTTVGRRTVVQQRKDVAGTGRPAAGVAAPGELFGESGPGQFVQPVDAREADLPLGEDGGLAGLDRGTVPLLRTLAGHDDHPTDHSLHPSPVRSYSPATRRGRLYRTPGP